MTRLLLAPAGHGKNGASFTHSADAGGRAVCACHSPSCPKAIQARTFVRSGRGNSTSAHPTRAARGAEVHTFHALYAELLIRADNRYPLCLIPCGFRCSPIETTSVNAAR